MDSSISQSLTYCSQYYKQFMIVIYNSKDALTVNLLILWLYSGKLWSYVIDHWSKGTDDPAE